MSFFQTAPTLGDTFAHDRLLRSWLERALPADVSRDVEPTLAAMGALAGGPLHALQLADRTNEPELVQWDAWGHRVDRIEVSPLWREAAKIAAEHGLVATAYERRHGALSRVHQFALVYLFAPSSDVYTCPLAMTDGAARTLAVHGRASPAARALVDRAVPRLTSRDPATAWTSGQWMTERTGGSDVGISETVARQIDGEWRLFGTKWFTSATTSQMALTLARPEGNPAGGRGLALFYVERDRPDGRANGILVNRLKDKLGTRKVPTAELTLDGAIATPVVGLDGGVRAITPMLNATRTWNAVCAVAGMQRAIALARDYGRRRVAFGARLADKPLHVDTLAGMQAEHEAGFHLTFRVVTLLGREECHEASADELELIRLLTPLAKLMTGKQAVAVASEALEAFGGAGYVEDTGLPHLLRDAQVLPIWEGTTNVLSLDTLRALGHGDGLAALDRELARLAEPLRDPALVAAGQAARAAFDGARAWVARAFADDRAGMEAGARRFAMTLARATALALACDHAEWALGRGDRRPRAAALRFFHHGVDQLRSLAAEDSALLAD